MMSKYIISSLICLSVLILFPWVHAFGGDQPSKCGLKVGEDRALERMLKWSNEVVKKADTLILAETSMLADQRYNVINDRFKEMGQAALEMHRCFRGYYSEFSFTLDDSLIAREDSLEKRVLEATDYTIKASRAAGKYNSDRMIKDSKGELVKEVSETDLVKSLVTMRDSYRDEVSRAIVSLRSELCKRVKGCFIVKEEF